MVPFGTDETISRVVEQYSSMLLRLACTRLDSTADAEDAVQEAFLRLLTARPVFRDAGHEKAWLIRTTLHRASDIRRAAEKQNVPLEEAEAAAPESGEGTLLTASLSIPSDRLVLVFVGRLAEEKNVEELLRLRASLGSGGVTLLLVGDGPHRPKLEALAAELGIGAPDAVFAGQVPPEQVADWYQLGDLFVSASTSETQGLTYAETLAAGVPALCRADPCLTGVIRNGENGWQYRDAADFRRKLDQFCAQPHRREALARQARRSAEQFSAERFAQRVEEIYREQIARHSRGEVSA